MMSSVMLPSLRSVMPQHSQQHHRNGSGATSIHSSAASFPSSSTHRKPPSPAPTASIHTLPALPSIPATVAHIDRSRAAKSIANENSSIARSASPSQLIKLSRPPELKKLVLPNHHHEFDTLLEHKSPPPIEPLQQQHPTPPPLPQPPAATVPSYPFMPQSSPTSSSYRQLVESSRNVTLQYVQPTNVVSAVHQAHVLQEKQQREQAIRDQQLVLQQASENGLSTSRSGLSLLVPQDHSTSTIAIYSISSPRASPRAPGIMTATTMRASPRASPRAGGLETIAASPKGITSVATSPANKAEPSTPSKMRQIRMQYPTTMRKAEGDSESTTSLPLASPSSSSSSSALIDPSISSVTILPIQDHHRGFSSFASRAARITNSHAAPDPSESWSATLKARGGFLSRDDNRLLRDMHIATTVPHIAEHNHAARVSLFERDFASHVEATLDHSINTTLLRRMDIIDASEEAAKSMIQTSEKLEEELFTQRQETAREIAKEHEEHTQYYAAIEDEYRKELQQERILHETNQRQSFLAKQRAYREEDEQIKRDDQALKKVYEKEYYAGLRTKQTAAAELRANESNSLQELTEAARQAMLEDAAEAQAELQKEEEAIKIDEWNEKRKNARRGILTMRVIRCDGLPLMPSAPKDKKSAPAQSKSTSPPDEYRFGFQLRFNAANLPSSHPIYTPFFQTSPAPPVNKRATITAAPTGSDDDEDDEEDLLDRGAIFNQEFKFEVSNAALQKMSIILEMIPTGEIDNKKNREIATINHHYSSVSSSGKIITPLLIHDARTGKYAHDAVKASEAVKQNHRDFQAAQQAQQAAEDAALQAQAQAAAAASANAAGGLNGSSSAATLASSPSSSSLSKGRARLLAQSLGIPAQYSRTKYAGRIVLPVSKIRAMEGGILHSQFTLDGCAPTTTKSGEVLTPFLELEFRLRPIFVQTKGGSNGVSSSSSSQVTMESMEHIEAELNKEYDPYEKIWKHTWKVEEASSSDEEEDDEGIEVEYQEEDGEVAATAAIVTGENGAGTIAGASIDPATQPASTPSDPTQLPTQQPPPSLARAPSRHAISRAPSRTSSRAHVRAISNTSALIPPGALPLTADPSTPSAEGVPDRLKRHVSSRQGKRPGSRIGSRPASRMQSLISVGGSGSGATTGDAAVAVVDGVAQPSALESHQHQSLEIPPHLRRGKSFDSDLDDSSNEVKINMGNSDATTMNDLISNEVLNINRMQTGENILIGSGAAATLLEDPSSTSSTPPQASSMLVLGNTTREESLSPLTLLPTSNVSMVPARQRKRLALGGAHSPYASRPHSPASGGRSSGENSNSASPYASAHSSPQVQHRRGLSVGGVAKVYQPSSHAAAHVAAIAVATTTPPPATERPSPLSQPIQSPPSIVSAFAAALQEERAMTYSPQPTKRPIEEPQPKPQLQQPQQPAIVSKSAFTGVDASSTPAAFVAIDASPNTTTITSHNSNNTITTTTATLDDDLLDFLPPEIREMMLIGASAAPGTSNGVSIEDDDSIPIPPPHAIIDADVTMNRASLSLPWMTAQPTINMNDEPAAAMPSHLSAFLDAFMSSDPA